MRALGRGVLNYLEDFNARYAWWLVSGVGSEDMPDGLNYVEYKGYGVITDVSVLRGSLQDFLDRYLEVCKKCKGIM